MSEAIKSIENKIDNYNQTIIAIVGFMNFYSYDSKHEPVILFQGRRLQPSVSNSMEYVTPDIGILLPNKTGVLGEVKHSLPRDKNLWRDIFAQLLKYDDNLSGWPNSDNLVDSHDLVLLTHQSRARAVLHYFREKSGNDEIVFKRPFCIIEYNLTSERQDYFFFRIEEGILSDPDVNYKLQEGVPVPMVRLLQNYAAIKFYDDMPELPYLMHLIWVYIVMERASSFEQFSSLAKNQKLDVKLHIDEIVDILRTGYSFQLLNPKNSDRQPSIPKKTWIKEACHKFVQWGEAKWNDDLKSSITFHCHKKYDDTLKHFIKMYVGEGNLDQQTLFDDDVNEDN